MSQEKDPSNQGALPNPGFVKNVCRKWTLHEDESLAHRLQEEEFKEHFGRNREGHKVVQADIRVARSTQNMEIEEIQKRRAEHVRQLKALESKDKELAEQLQSAIIEEDFLLADKIRERDEMLAARLQKEEEALAKSSLKSPSATSGSSQQFPVRYPDRSHPVITPQNSVDWTEYPREPPVSRQSSRSSASATSSISDKTTRDPRTLQAIQDEELARKLQELETQLADDDYRIALEEQDAEYARLLDEKEKARQKKASPIFVSIDGSQNSAPGGSRDAFPPVSSARYFPATTSNAAHSSRSPGSSSDHRAFDAKRSQSTQPAYTNVATLLDPTYKPNGFSPEVCANDSKTALQHTPTASRNIVYNRGPDSSRSAR